MPKYNLSELTEFSTALVYGFEPEGSPHFFNGSTSLEDTLYYQVNQHVDVLEGYLFAQNTILPHLKSDLDKITPAQIIEWIKSIHQRIGKSLLDVYGETSGEFCQKTVMHWESSGEILKPILVFLSGYNELSLSDFAEHCAAEFPVKKDELIAFMKILGKLDANKAVKLSSMQEVGIEQDSPYVKGSTILTKLQAAYHGGQLTTPEMAAVDRIVRVCLPPEKMPAAMEAYGKNFVVDLKKVDPRNLDSVADFIAEKFFALTFTHPFANANGRTATCFMNLFLRAFGYPSILLRYPTERDDAESSYSRAFAQVSTSRDLLKAHIKQRILDETRSPYKNTELEKIVELRVAILTLYKRIQANHPTFNLDKAHSSLIDRVPSVLLSALSDEQQSTFVLQYMLASMGDIEQALDAEKAKKMLPTPENILAKLAEISGQSNWKGYKKNTVFLLENPSQEIISQIAVKLKAIGAMTLTESKRSDNKMPVLKVEAINVKRLLEFTDAPAVRPAETDEKKLSVPRL